MLSHQDILGIDAGARALKIAHLCRAGLSWRAEGVFSVDRRGRPEDVARVMREQLRARGWLGMPCMISLRSELLSMRLLDAPVEGETAWRKMAASHIESFEVLAGAPAVTEFALMKKGGLARLMLVTARVDAIEREMDLARSAGLQTLDIAPAPLAWCAGLRRILPRSLQPVIGLDIGPEGTEFMVAYGHALLHYRRISIGERHLNAEEHEGLPPRERPYFVQWLEEIHSAYRAFNVQYEHALERPGALALTGGYPLAAEQRDRISEVMELELHDPVIPSLPDAGSYVTAIGLAWMGIRRSRSHMSLLPPGIKAVENERRQSRYWMITCLALCLAAVLALVNTHRDMRAKTRLLAEQEIWVKQLQQWEEDRARLQERNAQLRQQVLPLRHAARNNQAVRALMGAVADTRAPDDWFVFVGDVDSYTKPASFPVEAESPSSVVDPLRYVVLEGYTPLDDLSTVRAMIEALRAYPFVVNVDLLADDKIQPHWSKPFAWMDKGARRFALEVEMTGGGP
jgi:hypothetical protein